MTSMKRAKAVLYLADGTLFEGLSIGKKGTSGGEICFNTGMTGYQEIYTDPSYYGQIVINTNAHIGNYGVHKDEDESDRPKIKGLVVNDFTYDYSRSSASGSLEDYLSSHDTVGISDLDTRMLVRHVRDKGAMNAIISTEIFDIAKLQAELKNIPGYEILRIIECRNDS